MTLNQHNAAGIAQRTNVWSAKRMLTHAKPEEVIGKVTTPIEMPSNKSEHARFRRAITLDAKITPLKPGVTPKSDRIRFEDIGVSMKQYGQVLETTDWMEAFHEDPVLKTMTMLAGENIGRTLEQLRYGVAKGGTNVFFASSTTPSRANVDGPVTLQKQRKITRALRRQKAKPIKRIISASDKFGTSPIERSYIAVGHSDLDNDIRNLPGFVPVAKYGNMKPICDEEIGACENVRYVLSADLMPWEDAGAATSTMLTTLGSNADVYPILYFGQDAFASIALRGKKAIDPSVIPSGTKSKSDPLGQRAIVGWSTFFAALRTNELWMARLEVAATDLD